MKISELKIGMRNVAVEGKVDEMGDERTVNLKSGGTNRVAEATINDETGSVKLVLWGSDIDKVRPGDKVAVENGYTNSYRGDIQLAVGKFGKLKRL